MKNKYKTKDKESLSKILNYLKKKYTSFNFDILIPEEKYFPIIFVYDDISNCVFYEIPVKTIESTSL